MTATATKEKDAPKKTTRKPKETEPLPLEGDTGGSLKTLDGKQELYGNQSKRVVELADAHSAALEHAEDALTLVKESKTGLHKELDAQRRKGKVSWVRKQTERRSYKFEATERLEMVTTKETV